MAVEDFQHEHYQVLKEAGNIYIDKSRVRGQMWLDFPPSDKIRELRERITRIGNAYELREDLPRLTAERGSDVSWSEDELEKTIVEDALDTINYAVFLIKQIRRGVRG